MPLYDIRWLHFEKAVHMLFNRVAVDLIVVV